MPGLLKYYSRQVAQEISRPCYVISIGNAGDGCKLSPEHKSVLRLEFDDISEDLGDEYILFSIKEARLIIDWLNSVPEDEVIIVHCEAGISRSGAVAKFIEDNFDYKCKSDVFCKADFYLMNDLVYRILSETFKSD